MEHLITRSNVLELLGKVEAVTALTEFRDATVEEMKGNPSDPAGVGWYDLTFAETFDPDPPFAALGALGLILEAAGVLADDVRQWIAQFKGPFNNWHLQKNWGPVPGLGLELWSPDDRVVVDVLTAACMGSDPASGRKEGELAWQAHGLQPPAGADRALTAREQVVLEGLRSLPTSRAALVIGQWAGWVAS